jgi:hypothetical protein
MFVKKLLCTVYLDFIFYQYQHFSYTFKVFPALDLLFLILASAYLCTKLIVQWLTFFSPFVADMQLVVFLVVKIRNHSGVLLLNALLDCLKTNQDMLWYKLDF